MLSFKYISSTGQEFDLLTMKTLTSSCNAFNYAFEPITFEKKFGSKIYGFNMKSKAIEMTLYFFGRDRVQRINELLAAFDSDILNETPGTLVCNGYSIQGFCVEMADASPNSSNLLWDSFKRKFICPYPFWTKEESFTFFQDSEEEVKFSNIKDYADANGTVSEDGVADYPRDLMYNPDKKATLDNTETYVGSEWKLVINGAADHPHITIGDMQIELDLEIRAHQFLTIDSREKTVILTDEGGAEHNRYGYRDVAVDIFKKIPRGLVPVSWIGDFSFSVTLYDERTAPVWI